jgi:hypothetical protein
VNPPTFAELARQFPAWVKKNIVATIVTAVISGAVAYVINIWLMAVRYEGSATPSGAPATSEGNFLAGGLFWAMLPMVVCSVVSYRRSVGRERFWQDVRGLPTTLVGLFRHDGAQGRVHLLWGSAIALAASVIVSPAAGAVLGVGLLLAAPSIVGQMVSSLVSQVWHQVSRRVSPTKVVPVPPATSAAVGLLGASVALVASFMVPSQTMRFVLAAACAGGAFFIGQQAKAPGVAALLLVVAGAYVLADALFASPALADDGGFAECGSTIEAWLQNCAGADVVRRLAGAGGIISALAGPIGTFLGGFIGGFVPPGGGGTWWDGGGTGQPRQPQLQPQDQRQQPPSSGGPDKLINPDTGKELTVNDGRYPDGKPGQVWWDGRWVDPADARESIDKVNEWKKREDDYNNRKWEENKAWSSQGVDDKVKKFQKEEADWRKEQQVDKAATTTLENIKEIAKRHGFEDIMERAGSANVLDENGKPNEDYINKLRDTLRRQLNIDKALPPGSTSTDWFMDGLTETGKDLVAVGRSIPVRIAVGIATGGSSEVVYQGIGFGERMADAADKAIKSGKNMDFSDFVREGIYGFADENLPVNTYKNLRDGKTDLWSLGTGLAGDAFAILNIRDTGGNIKRALDDIPLVRSPGDLLDNLHKGTEMGRKRAIQEFDASTNSYKNAPEGIDVPPDRVKDFGLSPEQARHAQDAARNADANIQVRPAAGEGINLRAEGHPPKPEFIKNKTINDADTYLGARPQDKGMVGSFPPRVPDPDLLANQIKSRNPGLSEAQVANKANEIQARAIQRLDEFADQQAKLNKLVDQGKVKIDNGVVVDMRPGPGQGKGFTADLDLYDAAGAGGSRGTQLSRDALVTNLRDGPFDVQHGFHKDWKPVGHTNIEIDARIRSSHGPGGEGLLEIRADGGIKVRYDDSMVRQADRITAGASITGAAAADAAFGPDRNPPPPPPPTTRGDR